jgi:3-phenylpropionate/trans-cinnamate dioxygenase ferredoxin reductase subunit
MGHYKYVIVGGGMTAHAAVQGIRKVDSSGTIAVFGAESDAPYKRPPLSKGLWSGDPLDSIAYNTADLGAELHLGNCVRRLLPEKHAVVDASGTDHTYDRLLIATGARPRRLPFGGDDINYYRTLDDYRHLRDDVERFERFAVIGGGFIGSEIAAALAKNGRKVTMIFPEGGISSRVFSSDLSNYVGTYFETKGVKVLAGGAVTDVQRQGNQFVVKASYMGEDAEILVDRVVAGIGVVPNVELASEAQIQVDNGIVVDEYLRTTAPDIFAAGDIAAFVNPALGSQMRVEHEDNAKTMGRIVGQNMGGASLKYDHLPFFYSDLFDLGYEAVGEVDSRMETVVDWKEPYKEGVTYYMRDGRVRGVLLWNVWGQVPAARRLIAEPGPFSTSDLKNRLPEAK